MVTEGPRTPRWTWLLIAAALVLLACSAGLRSRTRDVTWYELGLMGLAGVLVVCAWVLMAPSVIHRLRPSSYEHKSTTGERVVLAVLWVVVVAGFLTISTGPPWAPLALLVVAFAGLVLMNQRQKRRIRGR
jgi:cobalamin synthase